MTDRPIIFSGPMVRALLNGCKTQTRRLATSPLQRCEAGDRLYVRETWGCLFCTDDQKPRDIDPRLWSVRYFADDHIRPALSDGSLAKLEQIRKKRTAIHMPRWASRITLIVESVRIEPLQAISEADAEAEGCVWDSADGWDVWYVPGARLPRHGATAAEAYRILWTMLHGDQGAVCWAANPDVLALTFAVEQSNIDRLAA